MKNFMRETGDERKQTSDPEIKFGKLKSMSQKDRYEAYDQKQDGQNIRLRG